MVELVINYFEFYECVLKKVFCAFLVDDLLYGLWTVEEIRELPEEEITRYNYLREGAEAGAKARGDGFFNNNEDENEENSANDNAQEEQEGGDDNDDDDEDEDSSVDEKERKPGVKENGNKLVADKLKPVFGGNLHGDVNLEGPEDNQVIRGRREEEGPIEGLRHAMGHDDASMNFFKNVEKNGSWK